jgi:thiamine-monophosphate kinase
MKQRRSSSAEVLRDIGETGWLERLGRSLRAGPEQALVGFGDDAACLSLGPAETERILLVTMDVLIQNTHFTWKTVTPASLGYKAVAVNVSDIAAMGGRPTAMVMGMGTAGREKVERLEAIARAVQRACSQWEIGFVGGDTVHSENFVLAITLLGEFDGPRERLPLRSRLHEGQRLYATGTLGDSAAGLSLMVNSHPTRGGHGKSDKMEDWRKALIERHRRPVPRLEEGRLLAEQLDDLAMIDLSDDLHKSVRLLREASGMGLSIRLDRVPMSRALRQYCRAADRDPLEFALFGGEDFELLFATRAEPRDLRRLFRQTGLETPLAEIGRVEGETVHWLDGEGREVDLNWKAYEHFDRE